MIAAAKADGLEGETFNLGVGKDILIGDLVQLILELTGSNTPVDHEDSRIRPAASEVDRLCSNPSKAREAFGWAPKYSLRDGLAATIEWMRSQGAHERVAEFVV
jgi:nucleoside-diphosphate-sugar epimerase